jgi:hypothetical protein
VHEAISTCCSSAVEESALRLLDVFKLQVAYDERKEKREFIHDALKKHGSRSRIIDWDNVAFCTKCWCLLHGVPLSTYYDVRKQMKSRASFKHKKRVNVPSFTRHHANAFIQYQKANFGDYMPHMCKVRLPYVSWPKLYEVYLFHAQKNGYSHVSKSAFCTIIKSSEHKDLSFKYGKGEFSICDTCFKLDEEMNEMKKSRTFLEQDMKALNARRKAHYQVIEWDRGQYSINCNLSMNSPGQYISICIDAMDQFKTNLPYFHRFPKKLDKVERIKNRLVGAIVHGRKPAKFLFHAFDNISADANLVLTIIMILLKRFENELPPTLFLQLDNCPGENKNRFVFSALVRLLELGLFKHIYVNFLLVGHTHIDIDRYFAYLSEALNKSAENGKPVCSMAYFIELVKAAWQTKTARKSNVLASGTTQEVKQRYDTDSPPEFQHIHRTFDFKGWVRPHIKSNWSGHSQPRHFKIEKDSNGRASIQYRMTLHNKFNIGYTPEDGIYPFNSSPDLNELRYASTRNRIPMSEYRKTINLLQEENHLTESQHAEWMSLFEGTEVHNCTDCNELAKKHYDFHVSTKPTNGRTRRTSGQLETLRKMKEDLNSHMKNHELVTVASLPSQLFEEEKMGSDDSENNDEEEDPTVVLKAPDKQVFTIGQRAAAFTNDIRIDDLVLIKLEDDKKAVAKAKGLDDDNRVVVHWYGNGAVDDFKKPIRPCWKCTYEDGRIEYSYGQKPSRTSMRKHKYSHEPFEQAIDADSIIRGPLTLTQQKKVRQKDLK